MIANRFPASPWLSRIAWSAKGKVCIVTITMSFPASSSAARSPDLDPVPALRTWSALIEATVPSTPSICLIAVCSWSSSTVRSVTTMTVSKTFSLWWSNRVARPCAVQAIELVLPEPAECIAR